MFLSYTLKMKKTYINDTGNLKNVNWNEKREIY